MSYEYRLNIFTPTGDFTLTPADELFSIDDVSFTPDGNCTEATFRCVPSVTAQPITPRSTVYFQTKDSGNNWINRWLGYVSLAGNPRSKNVETFRAVGLKQRLYEVQLTKLYGLASADPAAQADAIMTAVFDSASTLNGSTFAFRDAPTLGFTNGVLYPLVGSAGQILDNLAATVGQFIVPTGQTYTYDGVTYAASAVVPKVIWGIRATSNNAAPTFFFRRTFTNAASYAETDLDVDVAWPGLSGEEVISEPVLQYFPNMDWSKLGNARETGANARFFTIPVAQPMIYKAHSANQSQRIVQVPNPNDYLEELTVFTTGPTGTGGFTSFANAFDGNPATSVDGNVGDGLEYFVSSTFSTSQTQSITPGSTVLRLDIEYGDTNGAFVEVGHRATVGVTTRIWRARYTLPAQTDTGRVRFDFPILPPVEFISAANFTVWDTIVFIVATAGPNGSSGTVKVFDARPFAPTIIGSTVLADRLAAMFRVPVPAEVTNVKVFDDEPLRTRIDLTPEVGSVIEVPVERVQYSITTAEGVTTTYHAGQAFDGELVSERVVLEGLARRAVRS